MIGAARAASPQLADCRFTARPRRASAGGLRGRERHLQREAGRRPTTTGAAYVRRDPRPTSPRWAGAASRFNVLTLLFRSGRSGARSLLRRSVRALRSLQAARISRRVALLHDYPLYEFTILVRTAEATWRRLVIFGAGDIARLAHHYFTPRQRARGRRRSPSTAAFRQRRHVSGPAAGRRRRRAPAGFRRPSYEMFVALSYAKMNGVRAEKYDGAKAAGYRLVSYVSSRCTLPAATPAGRQLLHPRGQHHPAVRHDRQRRDAVERQPHRPRLDDRGPLLHHLARRRLRARARRRAIASSASTPRCATRSRSRRRR